MATDYTLRRPISAARVSQTNLTVTASGTKDPGP